MTIVIIAEGYDTDKAGKASFEEDARKLLRDVLAVGPLWRLGQGDNLVVYPVHDDSDSSPLSSAVDGSTRELSIDETALEDLITNLEVDVPGDATTAGEAFPWPTRGGRGIGTALVVVLVAEPGDGIYGHGETTNVTSIDQPYWVAVHAVDGAEVIVAKAIGRAMGLVDEGEDSAHVPAFDRYRAGPNIGRGSAAEDSSDPNFPWAHLAGPGYAGPYEGAQGASTDTYRYAEHCIMRVPIGAPNDVEAEDTLDFCLACEAAMHALLAGSPQAIGSSRKTLDRQRSAWDEAAFTTLEELSIPSVISTWNASPPGITYWWEFDAELSSAEGLVVENLIIRVPDHCGGPGAMEDQPVMQKLEFCGLRLDLAETTGLSIDLSGAIATEAMRGKDPSGDTVAQEGLRYAAVVPVGSGSQRALIEIELLVVLRGPAADFDPPGAVEGLGMFPQIVFSQVDAAYYADELSAAGYDAADFQGYVARFYGEVRHTSNMTSPPGVIKHMEMALGPSLFGYDSASANSADHPPTNRNYIGLFVDMASLSAGPSEAGLQTALKGTVDLLDAMWGSTEFGAFMNKVVGRSSGTIQSALMDTLGNTWTVMSAAWLSIFDYVDRDVEDTREFLAVPDMDHPTHNARREGDFEIPWTNGLGGKIERKLFKEAGMAAFDNIHVHGTMGTVGGDTNPATRIQRVMAPGCGHSCWHLHWRWGNGAFWTSGMWNTPAVVEILYMGVMALTLDGLVSSGLLSETEETAEALAQLISHNLMPYFTLNPKYKGWSRSWNGGMPRAMATVGAPLVPPNQTVRLGLETPTPSSWDGTTRSLDGAIKVIRYIAEVDTMKNAQPSWRHVVCEHGSAVAVAYVEGGPEFSFRALMAVERWDVEYLPDELLSVINGVYGSTYSQKDISQVFTEAYDVIPFLERYPNPLEHSIVPGNTTLTGSSTTMEDL